MHLDARHLPALQNHIVDLGHQQVHSRLGSLKHKRHSMTDFAYSTRKENILVKLKRLLPGSTSSTIGGIWDEANQSVITDSEGIAHELTTFWQRLFDKQEIDEHLLSHWLSRHKEKLQFSGDPAEFLPSVADVERALDEASDSSPGPDGIPPRVWRLLRSIVGPLFCDLANTLCSSSPEEINLAAPDFNHAFLCCLGKKPKFSDEVGYVFAPASTRPLSVVNSDNRILANIFRLKISPILEE